MSHKGKIDVTNDEDTLIILDAINLARRDIRLETPKKYFFVSSTTNTTIGSGTVVLDSDVGKISTIRYQIDPSGSAAERFLIKVETDEDFFKKIYDAAAPNAPPTHYVNYESKSPSEIRIFPNPDKVYTLNYRYYRRQTTDILGVGDLTAAVPEIPAAFQNLLCKGAVSYTLLAFDDPKAGEWEQRFYRDIAKANIFEETSEDSLLSFRLKGASIKKY